MVCPSCKAENPDQANFCLACGQRLRPYCSSCKIENPVGARFCVGCGTALERRLLAFGRGLRAYSPPPEELGATRSRDALEGDRRHVTVLFADLQRSMSIIAGRDPEAADEILGTLIDAGVQAVRRYRGTVNRIMGDGFMALFGAPLAQEDHAVRACLAAVAMRRAVRESCEQLRSRLGVDLRWRIGLNSGEVVARAVRNDLSIDYDAMGETVHIAARMEQTALGDTIQLTDATRRLAGKLIEVRPLGLVTIKGLERPVQAYELLDVMREVGRGIIEAQPSDLTPFVGRRIEMLALRAALEKADSGNGQFIAIVGEPGCGKSRLIREFVGSFAAQNWTALQGRAASFGPEAGFFAAADLFRSYFGLEGADTQREMHEKIAEKIALVDETLSDALPAFHALCGLIQNDSNWSSLDPADRQRRMIEAARRLFWRLSEKQPLVLVFEDLQWLDAETEAILNRIADGVHSQRVLLLVSFRPEYEHRWSGNSCFSQYKVDPLSPRETREFLSGLLGPDPGLASLVDALILRTRGNPLFLEELVRELTEQGVLAGKQGQFRLARPAEAVQVPATVQAVLAARLDRLPNGAKHVLESAAVIGETVPYALLEAVVELPPRELAANLEVLERSEFLDETRQPPDREFTFRHALIHEVVYGSIVQERRRLFHTRVVSAMERVYGDRWEDHSERLAYHAERATLWEKVVRYARSAGSKVAARSANREAATFFQQALDALQHVPGGTDRDSLELDLRFDLRLVLARLGELRRLRRELMSAVPLAQSLADPVRMGQLQVYLSHIFWITGEQEQALSAGQQALDTAARLHDPALSARTKFQIGLSQMALGNYRRAISLMQDMIGAVATRRFQSYGLNVPLSIVAGGYMARCYAELGEFEAGGAVAQESVRSAAEIDDRYSAIFAYLGAGYLYLRRGDADRAVPLLEEALQLSITAQGALMTPAAQSFLAAAYVRVDRVGEAVKLLERAVETAEAIGFLFQQPLRLAMLGEAYLAAGNIAAAIDQLDRARENAETQGELGAKAYASLLLGEARRRRKASAEAAAPVLEEALQIATRLEMTPLLGECHLIGGRLQRDLGSIEAARTHVSRALDLFQRVGMARRAERCREVIASLPVQH